MGRFADLFVFNDFDPISFRAVSSGAPRASMRPEADSHDLAAIG
jgi:hypothetical protein